MASEVKKLREPFFCASRKSACVCLICAVHDDGAGDDDDANDNGACKKPAVTVQTSLAIDSLSLAS